jgi:hypothetical protein
MGRVPKIFSELLINTSAASRVGVKTSKFFEIGKSSTYWLASAAVGPKRQNYVWLFSVTVQVIPAAINTPAGTLVMRMRTGMR